MKPIPAIVLAPLIAHPIWGILMFTAPRPIHTIGIDATYKLSSSPIMAAVLMIAASSGAWASHMDRFHGKISGFALVGLQQFLMLMTLWTIIIAVWYQKYANGYAPPEGWSFIAADQVFFAVCAILHTRAIWRTYIQLLNGKA